MACWRTTYVLQPILLYNMWENLQASEAYILKTFALDDIEFGRVVKKWHFLEYFKSLDLYRS